MRQCPFCHRSAEGVRLIEEREYVYALLSDPYLIKGHTLIIPKRHVERPSELTDDERIELFDTVLEYQDKILDQFASGCDIRQNCKPFLPESKVKVNHVHFHLLPREFEDEYYETSQCLENKLWQDLADEDIRSLKRVYG